MHVSSPRCSIEEAGIPWDLPNPGGIATSPPLNPRRRFTLLAVLATAVVTAVGTVAITSLYQVGSRGVADGLRGAVSSQARFLEAVYADEVDEHGGDTLAALEGALDQLRRAQANFDGFGATGEFTVGVRDGDLIRFHVGLREDVSSLPDPVPFLSDLAEPMRRALAGQTGVGVSQDYRGTSVLAAYMPVGGTPLGMVAKQDVAEVRAPYIRAAMLAGGVGFVMVGLAWVVAWIVGVPLLAEVEEREAAHRAFLDHFPGVAFRAEVGNRTPLRFGALDGAVQTLTGWSREHFLADELAWLAMVHEEDRNAVAAGWGSLATASDHLHVSEYRIRRRDGKETYVRTVARSVVSRTGPTVYGLHYDVTERRSLDRALKTKEGEVVGLLERLPGVAVHVLDLESRFVFSAGAALAELGLSDDALRGRRPEDVLPDGLATPIKDDYRQALEGRATRHDGHVNDKDFLIETAPLRDADGHVERVLVLLMDVTEDRRQKRALAVSEERLRQILKAGRHGFYDLDLITGRAEVNDEYARMIGHDPATFSESHEAWRSRIHPDDRERVFRAFDEYLAGIRDDYAVEFRQRTRDGGWVWHLSTGAFVEWDGSGRPTRMLGTHTDLTRQKELETELRERTSFLQAVLDHAPAMYCVFDPAGGIRYANPAYVDFFGWTLEELQAHPDFLAEIFPDPVQCRRARDFIRMGGGVWEEFRPRLRSGATPHTVFANVVLEDGTSVGIGQDISQRKVAQDALARSEDLFRSAVEEAPDAIFIQTGWCFAYANAKALELFGVVSLEELVGRAVLDFFHDDDRVAVAQRIRALNVSRESVPPREETVLRPDGTHVRCEFSGVPFTFNGLAGAMVFARDVTARHEAEGRIREQLEELKRWQEIMLGREDRVRELKQEVNELCSSLGVGIRYPSQREGDG